MITNQSVIGRGMATQEEVNNVNQFILTELFKLCGAIFDFVYYCPHTPEDRCLCRKPNIGLIKNELVNGRISTSQSFMIGDQESDILFGKNIGVTTILISNQNDLQTQADYIVSDFSAIKSLIQLPT